MRPTRRGKLTDLKSDNKLPHLKDMPVPTVEELHKLPVDWIVLKGGTRGNESVLAVRQVYPRPETLRKMEQALENLRGQPKPTTDEERDKLAAQREELQHLTVTLPDDAAQIYELPTDAIDHIIYHEDLIIRRATLLVEEQKFRDAYELLFALARTQPKWNGLEEKLQRVLFIEAETVGGSNDLESAFTYLEELDGRNRQFPDLQTRLGDVASGLIREVQKSGDLRRARFYVERLARIEPQHEVVGKWTDELLVEAQKMIRDGRKRITPRDGSTNPSISSIGPSAPGRRRPVSMRSIASSRNAING